MRSGKKRNDEESITEIPGGDRKERLKNERKELN